MKASIYKLHQLLSIRAKLIFAFLTVALLSVLLMSAISYINYTQSAKEDFYRLSKEATLRLNQHIEFYIFQLAKSTSSLLASELLQDWMMNNREYSLGETTLIKDEMRKEIALNYSEIVGMFLVTREKQVLGMSTLPLSRTKSYKNEPWYGNAFHHDIRVLPTHSLTYPTVKNVRAVSLEIPIYSVNTLDLIGKLVIDFGLEEMERIFQNANIIPEGNFFVFSEDDRIVYHDDEGVYGIPRSETGLADLDLSGNVKASIQELNNQKVLVSMSKSESTGWMFVHTVPLVNMTSAMQNAPNVIFLTLMIVVVGIIIIVPLISNRFVRPILELKQLMLDVECGNLSVRAPVSQGKDEIQHLNRSFNNMVEQIDKLLDTVSLLKLKEANLVLREKEALIQALQNQINPHFLFNSLDIIKSIAYVEDVPQVVKMSRNLADFYRYTGKNDHHQVTLRDELDHLKHYLALLHIRFPDHFYSQINVKEQLLDGTVIKLMIQPLVENAVKYAIEPNEGKGEIIVSAYEYQDQLVIEITNNGKGISQEKAEGINKKLSFITDNVNQEYQKQQSVGLANVHARIVLKYGKQFGIRMIASDDEETTVLIRLPISSPIQNAYDKDTTYEMHG
jgi:two-component system, sensor histidine kinase YesM